MLNIPFALYEYALSVAVQSQAVCWRGNFSTIVPDAYLWPNEYDWRYCHNYVLPTPTMITYCKMLLTITSKPLLQLNANLWTYWSSCLNLGYQLLLTQHHESASECFFKFILQTSLSPSLKLARKQVYESSTWPQRVFLTTGYAATALT